MALKVYRYKFKGFCVSKMNLICVNVPTVMVPTGVTTDLQVEETEKDDLDAAMAEFGWEFDQEVP
jgi:hypothetical protein